MRITKDVAAGGLFLLAGAAFLTQALAYPLGTATRMGAGAFPAILAALLIVIGTLVLGRGLVAGGAKPGPFAVRPLLFIVAAFLAFGFLIERTGLPFASVVLVTLAALASRDLRGRTMIALAVGLAAFVTLAFVVALGMPIPIRGPWLGG